MNYERHSLSAKWPDIQGQAWIDFLDNLKETGADGRKVWLYEGKILDGWQFYRGCLELNLEPELKEFKGNAAKAEAFVETQNYHRRHEPAEMMQRRACDRRDRVAKARTEGKSIRTIADEEGVGKATVERDLATVPPGTPVAPPGGKVTGKDGREQAATKGSKKAQKGPKPCRHCKDQGRTTPRIHPLCPPCQHNIAMFEEREAKAEAKEAAKKEKVGLKNAIMTAAETAAFFDALIPRDGEGQAIDALRLTARRVATLAKAFAEGRK